MIRSMRLVLAAGILVLFSHTSIAQTNTARAVFIANAPIVLTPQSKEPLRVAAAGTTVILLKTEGEWHQVQFQDPQYGLRTGYVNTKFVRVETATPPPLDLSVPASRSAPPSVTVAPATPIGQPTSRRPVLFIAPMEDGFETYLYAAMTKKGVPASVTTNPELATMTLKAASIEEEQVSTGKRVVNCLFAYCAGNENKASTSVTLIDASGTVLWSYSVNKGRGTKNRQSMAEAIAKHLKDDYLSEH